MTNPPPSPFARLRVHLAGVSDTRSTDSELVARFAATRDDGAFAELVRRHGPLVLAVCRRVTGNRDDADDAFQASFLVLARKPERVRADSPLAAWLYGVAVRAARKAVARTARRLSRVSPSPELHDVPDRSMSSDPETVRAVLEEVGKLPSGVRAAVVLCELEGRSRAAVARELGLPEGTLSSRLATARQVLARRFRDRGLAPAVFAAVAGSTACPVLAADAVRLGGASASPDPRVERLSEAVMKSAISPRVLLASAAAVVLSLGFALGGPDPAPAPKPVARLQPAAQPAAKPVASPNRILFYRGGYLTMIDPDGKNEKRVSHDRGDKHPGDSKLSPDGKMLAVLIQVPATPADEGKTPKRKLYVRGIDEKEPGTDLGVEGDVQVFAWSPDGTKMVYAEFVDGPQDRDPNVTTAIVDVKSKTRTGVNLPKNHVVTEWLADGSFLTSSLRGTPAEPSSRLYLMNPDGSEKKALTDGKQIVVFGRASPDGKRILALVANVVEVTPLQKKINDEMGKRSPRPEFKMALIDAATGKATPLEDLPLNGEVMGFAWSPDGKKIAYSWRQKHEGVDPKELGEKETESFLVVADADGKNPKTIATEKGNGAGVITIAHVDWR
jgi:RNA polymerase sigma factor (sigma-70 family)